METTATPAHLTDAELADRWHTTTNAIRVMRHRGDFPRFLRRGSRVLTPVVEVERWEAEHLVDPNPAA